MTNLILITSGFPYGEGETFLENELPILSRYFQNIFILPTEIKGERRPHPNNIYVETHLTGTHETGVLPKLRSLVDARFYRELSKIKQWYHLPISPLIFKQCLSSLSRGQLIADRLNTFINEKGLTPANLFTYSYWADENALGLALLKKQFHDIKAISRGHGWDVYFERRNTQFIPYRYLLFDHLDAVFFISENGRQYTMDKFPMHANKFHLSRLGTTDGKLMPEPHNANPFLLASVSNLIPLKRVNLIIDALAKLAFPVRWIHFGDGPEQQRLELHGQRRLQDKPNVEWDLKGQVSNQEVLDFYREEQPHLFINVSSTEGLPVSIMEAMAHSIPAIATNVGGTSEIVSNEINGLLLSSNPTPQEIAEAVNYFINLPEKQMTQYREKAHDTWQESFNAETNFRNFAYDLLQL